MRPPSSMFAICGTSNFRPISSSSATSCGNSMKMPSAPAARYWSARRNASSRPSTSRASVRARMKVSRLTFSDAYCADLGGHLGGGDHVLAGDMSAALRRELILEHDRRHAHPLVAVQRMHDILDVAIAVVAVDHHRQIAGRHDVGHGGRDFAERDQPDVGQSPARADGGKSAGEIGLEAGALDQARAERVERARQDQRALAFDELWKLIAA